MMRNALSKSNRDERGQALIIALILLLAGSLILAPLLSYMGSGLIAGRTYEENVDDIYAADAGIENALWQIKYDHLDESLTTPTAYDPYDYTTAWNYFLSEQVNARDVKVIIDNVWVPDPNDIPVPSSSEAKAIIESLKLVVTGTVTEGTTYKIKISYLKEETDIFWV